MIERSIRLALCLAVTVTVASCGVSSVEQPPSASTGGSGAQVQLSAQASPGADNAGTAGVVVTASNFPPGTLEADYFTVWLTPTCGGAGSTTTVPTAVIANAGGGSYGIVFSVPQNLLSNTYYVAITGTTNEGTGFASANCAAISVSGTLPGPVLNVVTQFGADPTGQTDDTAAIGNAIAQAQANGGGTVYFPPGTYPVGTSATSGVSLYIGGTVPITLAGAGMTQSTIVETDPTDDLLNVHVDGMVVEDLGFDTAEYGAGHCLGAMANNTTIERVALADGSRTFSVYFAGPTGASASNLIYNTGNQILDSTISDSVNDDSLSFSYQQNGTIRNIIHTGSRLALFRDQAVTVTDYQYTPGPQSASVQNGFYITPPSDDITIRNFVSSGQGGVIGPSGLPTINSSNINIIGEELLDPDYSLWIGDATGVTLQNGFLIGDGSGVSTLGFIPNYGVSNVTVNNVALQSIIFSPQPGASITGMNFNNDFYQPFAPEAATFSTLNANGAVSFAATGGQFCNTAGGFQSGPNTTYTSSVGPCS